MFRSILSLLLVPVLLSASAPSPPVVLHIPVDVESVMGLLSQGMNLEIPLCLVGKVSDVGRVIAVQKYFVPHLRASDEASVFFEGCSGKHVVGLWHNHPAILASSREWLCALSSADVYTAKQQHYAIMVVQVDKDTQCWWGRDQIQGIPDTAQYVASVKGQRTFN